MWDPWKIKLYVSQELYFSIQYFIAKFIKIIPVCNFLHPFIVNNFQSLKDFIAIKLCVLRGLKKIILLIRIQGSKLYLNLDICYAD
jgi:hypothetical protein